MKNAISNKKTATLHTLGCRLNQAETAIIANTLRNQGFSIVDSTEKADLTVVHTCTVTEQADSKCRQAVRKSIRNNPDTYVAVVGCYAQMAADTIKEIDGVDLIIGNEHKLNLIDYIGDLNKNDDLQIVHTTKISKNVFTIDTPGLYENQTRANLKIQDGCNFVCSFCIIAAARGPARSREFDNILQEAQKFAADGHLEIVITGVNLGTYQNEGKTLLDILKSLEDIDGLRRIRISSIEPTTITRELIDYMAKSKKLCRYLHIPLQSGDDTLLESMRRKHTVKEFREIIEYAHKTVPGIGLGTDILVGYPGESDEQFVNTKILVTDLPLAYYHVFSYSDREGTSSYRLKPKIDPQIKKLRTRIMIDVGRRQKDTFYRSFLNRSVDVLFEDQHDGYWEGFTDNYMRVRVRSEEMLNNQIRSVFLKFIENEKIIGELD